MNIKRTRPGSFDERDEVARRQTLDAEAEAIELLDDVILAINNGMGPLDGLDHDRGLNLATTLLVGRALNSLWRAREDLVCGYYVQAMMLGRTVFEDWVTMEWIEAEPARAALFLSGSSQRLSTRRTIAGARFVCRRCQRCSINSRTSAATRRVPTT